MIYKPTNITYGTITNAEGRFFLSNINPGGPYDIIVSFVGYKTEKQEEVFLKLGENLKVDFELSEDVQQLSEIVVQGVTENAAEKTGTSTNINRQQIMALPTLSRSFSDFTRLTPQSSNNSFAGT